MSVKSGHQIFPLIGEEAEKQYEDFHAYRKGTFRLQPDGWFFTSPFIPYVNKVYDFKFKPNDVLIMTYPKCGTTWTQELVWTIMRSPNLDNPKALISINARCPFLEFDFIIKGALVNFSAPGNIFYDTFVKNFPDKNSDDIFLQFAEYEEEPRILKTHLPFSLFPPNLIDTCKVIYVARNPKDVAVSFCHHSRLLKCHDYKGDISGFVDHFVNDTLLYSPYWTHLKEAWKLRSHKNVYYLFYEDMKLDPKKEINQIQNFLGQNLSDEQIENIAKYTSFSEMKSREESADEEPEFSAMFNQEVEEKDGGFLRKGIIGDWKNKLSDQDIEKIDAWTKENTEDLDQDFKYKTE